MLAHPGSHQRAKNTGPFEGVGAMSCAEPSPSDAAALVRLRQRCMGVVARARVVDVEALWHEFRDKPSWRVLRRPETGMIMTRARAGGTGQPFNLGEMTVTRCSVSLEGGQVGHGYVAGRGTRHAEMAAVVDALVHDTQQQERLIENIITPLERMHEQAAENSSKSAASTKVEFFSVVRHRE